ncbi:hypothetical protein CAPTEDRAFT_166869 [Capitella teleta]|uniref:Store-operated calcium entry regulator STIMATE n=1 Tax=Capitella teleta TaxID=283909 RepID=R7UMZ6_CAPTE|nr:hypothetical protein CAPTEDRAFT_166869 [Capitella teleta]|eukprot:ELU04766.1 hypothetical protein CAPTEDRAFT_166869 [Capitella teleta]
MSRHNGVMLSTLNLTAPPYQVINIFSPSPNGLPSPSQTTQAGAPHCGHGSLMGPLGLLVQVLLAFIAFSALIVKRFCEPKPERRPWKIWFFDTSKQAIGAAVIHFANVFLAEIFHGDPCTWYIISFLLDSTVGLFIIYLGLKISQIIAQWKGWESLYFGEYGTPPQCNAWIGQCGVYILVMLIEKMLMTLLILFNFWKKVRDFIMSPIKDPNLELIIVMFIVPFIINAFIFWVVDNFLKKQVRRKTMNVQSVSTNNDSGLKYFKSMDKVKYYQKVGGAEEGSDTDVLISADDEPVNTCRHEEI